MDPELMETLTKRSFDYLNTTPQAILLILDQAGIILSANTYASVLTGKDLPGRHLKEIILEHSWQDGLLDSWTHHPESSLMNIRAGTGLPRTLHITVYHEGSVYLLFGHSDSEETERLSQEILTLNQELIPWIAN